MRYTQTEDDRLSDHSPSPQPPRAASLQPAPPSPSVGKAHEGPNQSQLWGATELQVTPSSRLRNLEMFLSRGCQTSIMTSGTV